MFEKVVKKGDGTEKRVIADNKEELNEGVAAVRAESTSTSPDIDNPAHGNMTTAEFQANDGKRNEKNDAEAVPSSDESKELSRKLAQAKTDKEKAKVMQEDSDAKQPDSVPAPKLEGKEDETPQKEKVLDTKKQS